MTDLFEKCLKNAEPVQQKMDTNMMTIRNLDAQYQIKEQEAKQKLAALVNSWKKLSKEDQRRQYNAVLACFAEAKKLCDQKIDTASETYEMVDGFIQKLDCDTAKFTTFVQQKHANAGPVAGTSSSSRNKISAVELEPGSTSRKRRGTTSSASTSTPAASSHKRTPQKRGHDQTGTSVDEKESEEQLALAIVPAHGDMPVDPNEPRYCICQQVSFGNMVCCDNKNCSLEWFHFPCVDLTAPPKGKWFCPQCRESKEPKKTPRQRTTGKSIGKEASKD